MKYKITFFMYIYLVLFLNALFSYTSSPNPDPTPPLSNDKTSFTQAGWQDIKTAYDGWPNNRWGVTNDNGLYKMYGYGRCWYYWDDALFMWRDENPNTYISIKVIDFSNHSQFPAPVYTGLDQSSYFMLSVEYPWGTDPQNRGCKNPNLGIFLHSDNNGGTELQLGWAYKIQYDNPGWGRYDRGGNDWKTNAVNHNITLPIWLKVSHNNNELCEAFYSTDGVNWTNIYSVYMTNISANDGSDVATNTLVKDGQIRFSIRMASGYTDDWCYAEFTNVVIGEIFDVSLLFPTNYAYVSNSLLVKSRIAGTNDLTGYAVYLNNNREYTQNNNLNGTNIITNRVYVTNLSEGTTNIIRVKAYGGGTEVIIESNYIIVDNYTLPKIYFKDITNNTVFPTVTTNSNIWFVQTNASKLIFYIDNIREWSNTSPANESSYNWYIGFTNEDWHTLKIVAYNPGNEMSTNSVQVFIDNLKNPYVHINNLTNNTALPQGIFQTNILITVSNSIKMEFYIDNQLEKSYTNLISFSGITNFLWHTTNDGNFRLKVLGYNTISETVSNVVAVVVDNYKGLYGFISAPSNNSFYASGDIVPLQYYVINSNVSSSVQINFTKIYLNNDLIYTSNSMTASTNIVNYSYTVPNNLSLGTQVIKFYGQDSVNQIISNQLYFLRVLGKDDVLKVSPVQVVNAFKSVITIDFSTEIKNKLNSVSIKDLDSEYTYTGDLSYTDDDSIKVEFDALLQIEGNANIFITSVYNTVIISNSLQLYDINKLKTVELKDKVFRNSDFEVNISNPLRITRTVTVNIYDIKGHLIKKLYEGDGSDFLKNIKWDWSNEAGNKVSIGTYICIVEIKSGSGKEETIKKVFIKAY